MLNPALFIFKPGPTLPPYWGLSLAPNLNLMSDQTRQRLRPPRGPQGEAFGSAKR